MFCNCAIVVCSINIACSSALRGQIQYDWSDSITFKGPSYSTDRVEEVIVPGDSHTTTLDIKSIRKNKGPALSSEDDRNLSVSDQQYVRVSW